MTKRLTTRRQVLAAGAAAALAGCGKGEDAVSAGASAIGRPVSDALPDLPARIAVDRMRSGDMSAESYAGALLARAAAHAELNAFVTLEPDRVLEAAASADRERASGASTGALHGLPIPVKDSVNTEEYRTTGGTPALDGWRPAEDAEIVRRLRSAGGIVMGKTSVHELSFGWTSNNFAYGAVRNPWDPTRIPGGSSGGTAAAVAARMAPLGIAEDTQGSIRVPAALCGICGFRPTTGRYPNEGVIPITPLFDQVGPHARNVDDLSFFDEVITGEAPAAAPESLEGIRLGIVRDYFFDGIDSSVAAVVDPALARLEEAGAVLVEGEIDGLAELIGLTTAQVQGWDVTRRLADYLESYGAGLSFEELLAAASENIQQDFAVYALEGGDYAPTLEAYEAARDVHLPRLRAAMKAWFTDHRIDALVFPATMAPASPIGEEASVVVNGEAIPLFVAMARNISPGSTAGIPGLVLPAGLTGDGLPVSIELDAPMGADRSLLALGRAVESVLGTLPPPRLDGASGR